MRNQSHVRIHPGKIIDSELVLNPETSYRGKAIDQSEAQILKRLAQLEGECKVQSFQFIRFNTFKTIILMIPVIVSIIGLFAMKYSIAFRVRICYSLTKEEEATHMHIKGNNQAEDIVEISERNPIKFTYKKLAYILEGDKPIPGAFKYQQHFKAIFSQQYQKQGLNTKEIMLHDELYGKNQHIIEIPSFFSYMLDVLTTPFFLLQYIFCVVFIFEGYAPFSIALLFFSFTAATLNYILLYISYSKIKKIAQKQIFVNVLRNGKIISVKSTQLVPGDIFQPKDEIPCDALVLKGDVYVNEANLTGESHPIGKFPVTSLESSKQSNKWLYEGSKVFQVRPNTLAIAINVGFQTFRGRILRRILTRQAKEPDVFRSALIFLGIVLIFSMIAFFACLPIMLNIDIQPLFIAFQFFNFLASGAPPPLPIFFHIAYSLSLIRLKIRDISGTQPQKSVDGAYLKTLCFDKTGTLTENKVEIKKILNVRGTHLEDINLNPTSPEKKLSRILFASCHTVKIIDEDILGDQIDKEMFKFSQFEMKMSQNPQIKFIAQGQNGEVIQILRINQFQSRFQSMSILARDAHRDLYYIFVKGAPEKMRKNSQNQVDQYLETIESLSLNGYRTIAYGYKIINKEDVETLLHADREDYEQNLTLLGVVGFQNSLKHDAVQTIEKIIYSNIQPKIITGDNIFIAVQTAASAGIISRETPIILLEGHKQSTHPEKELGKRTFFGTVLKRNPNGYETQPIFLKQDEHYLTQTLPIAVDNGFISMDPTPELSEKIAIYARIPPDRKAFIISLYKEQIQTRILQTYSSFAQFLKKDRYKIGMCGDGANDLLALKQADVSMGIQETDASYGSNFTINNLLDIDQIIRDSKCTLSSIIQLYIYFGSISLLSVSVAVIMLTDTTFFSTSQLMFFNFTTAMILPAVFSFSRPSQQSTPYVPEGNFMCLHNFLLFWGNFLIPLAGFIGGYLFYFNTEEYLPNPIPKATIADGFNSENHTTTIVFLLVMVIFNLLAFAIYSSSPWRQRFYGNIIFTLLIFVNLSASITFYFITDKLKDAFQMVPISQTNAWIVLGIAVGTMVVTYVYNVVIRCFKLDHKTIS